MNFLLFLATLQFVCVYGNFDGNFTIITPNVIRSGKPFITVVRGFGLTSSKKFILRIAGTTESGSILSMKRVAKISDQKPRTIVQFDTSKILKGQYNFSVTTTNYTDSKSLIYKTNEYTFLIQTDKSIYFPNDIIRFRVLAINSETKSVNPKILPFISIKDAKGSVVFNVSDTGFIKGKYQSELQLPDTPAFGFWFIQAQSGNDTGGRFIEVADLQVPSVHSELTVQKKIAFSKKIIPIIIDTRESFNGNISGIATLTVKNLGSQKFWKKIDIDETQKIVEIDFEVHLGYIAKGVSSYDVELEYHDKLTNTIVRDSASFEVLPKEYTINLNGGPYIKPGSDYEFTVVVTKYDGIPRSAGTTVDITVENSDISQTLELDYYGHATSTISVPEDLSFILIKAVSEDAADAFLNVTLPFAVSGHDHGKKKETLRLDLVTENPVVDSEVTMEVTLSEQVDKVYCIITAKGLLLETIEVSIDIDINLAFQTARFTFNPTFAYAPIACIVGYYVRSDGKIVTASTSVELTGNLRNEVSYSFDVIELIPEEFYSFNVSSYINSTVSMFAYDQRLLSLRDAVTITKDEVISGLLNFYAPIPSAVTDKMPDYEFRFKFYGLNIFTSFKPHHSNYHYRKRSLLSELNESSKLNQMTALQLGGSRVIKKLKPFSGSMFWENHDIKVPTNNDETEQKGYKKFLGYAGYNLATFVLCSVSMSAYKGIGIPASQPKFGITMPFYLTVDTPYSIKVSQILVQGITLWQSYTLTDHTFNITIWKGPNFETDYDGVKVSKNGWIDAGNYYTRSVVVKPGKNNRVQFSLKATKVGYILLQISARSKTASDFVHRYIKVMPFGIYKVVSDTVKIKFTDTKLQISHNLTCKFSDKFIESHSANLTLAGDIMGRVISNLPTGLIQMPDGCGEQVLIYLVPDVIVWIYLLEINKMTIETQSTLQYYISVGYSRELSFRRRDGSFSAWGNRDRRGSTWLTTYASWAFYLANSTNAVFVDPNVLRGCLNYLSARQRGDGSFEELQAIYHSEMRGGVEFDITLTAYVSIMLTTLMDTFPEYKHMQTRAISYLEANWHSRTDVFGLAIITYALSLAESPKAGNIMNLFFAKRTENKLLNEISYGTIEESAYCLLILLTRGERLEDAEKIANYLVRISNEYGGYVNTQNTVMGVYALSKYSAFTKSDQGTGATDLKINSNDGDDISQIFDLNDVNDFHVIKLHQNASSVQVSSNGKRSGVFIASLSCGYYEESLTYSPPFNISFGGTYVCEGYFTLKISINYNVPGNSTGMTVATITFPSGFAFLEVPRLSATEIKNVKSIEDGHKVQLYFETLSNKVTTFSVTAVKNNDIEGKLEGYVQLVDSYFPDIQASASFALPDVDLKYCDLVFRRR